MDFKTAAQAQAQGRAERNAARIAGVVALQQTIDTDTEEVLEEPVVLVRYGELPPEFGERWPGSASEWDALQID